VTSRCRGSCLCGAVRYSVHGALRDSIACHCSQCRKTSGHYWSATCARRSDITIEDADGALRWYRSSDRASRGFCQHCGSSLFWQSDDADTLSIGSGTLDGPTGLKTLCHIYVDDKSDYVDIAPALAQWPGDMAHVDR